MKVQLIDRGTYIEYQVENLASKNNEQYKEVLLHFGFSQQNNLYTKQYNKEDYMFSQDTNVLEKNFQNHLQDMINNTIGNTNMEWEESLETIADIMQRNNIRWWIAGSAACAVRGINIHPQDIDIMTYKTEIEKIEKAFKEYTIEPFHHVTDWVVKGFGVVYLNGKVDIAFEPEECSDSYGNVDFGCYAMNNLETINWRGYSIRVPPAELHIHPNKMRNRMDRVKLIEEYLGSGLRFVSQ